MAGGSAAAAVQLVVLGGAAATYLEEASRGEGAGTVCHKSAIKINRGGVGVPRGVQGVPLGLWVLFDSIIHVGFWDPGVCCKTILAGG